MNSIKKDYICDFENSNVSSFDLEKINKLARTELTADSVYVFNVVLCDNEIDRDFERFSVETLNKLAPMFIGKTGIFDHNLKAENQVARIFETRVETDFNAKTTINENLSRLVARAYMLKNKKNEDLIAEIDAGIKKEVSVSCSVANVRCSICGNDRRVSGCNHVPGKSYGGHICHSILENPTDTYEWSFVAVPAQVGAGVTKAFKNKRGEVNMINVIKSANDGLTLSANEVETLKQDILNLEKFAQDGKLYKSHLQKEVLKMCGVTMPSLNMDTMNSLLERASCAELYEMKSALSKKMSDYIPPTVQLANKENNSKKILNTDFKM